MERITQAQIEKKVELLNKMTGNPVEPYTWEDGKTKSNAGCYYIAGAYGGWKLEQICEGGGARDISEGGFTSKRNLYNQIQTALTIIQRMEQAVSV